jgi:photosystem II stability/assembly factor-like uncharacterized protein
LTLSASGLTGLLLLGWAVAANPAQAGWERQESGITSEIDAIVFKSDSMGWLISGNQILNTTNGGVEWQVQHQDTIGGFNDIDFQNLDSGLAVGGCNLVGLGLQQYLAWTSNGGASWNSAESGGGSYCSYTSCRMLGPGATWIAGFESDVTDWLYGQVEPFFQPGGPSLWTTSLRYDDVDAVDSLHAWALSYYWYWGTEPVELDRTDALTDNWELACDSFPGAMGECRFDFISPARGWMACQGGRIRVTTDSGFHWSDQYFDSTMSLRSVAFADSSNGLVVGDSGVILRTRDGGVHWQVELSGTGSDLYTVCLRDTMNGWAAGTDGTVIHYSPNAAVAEPGAARQSCHHLTLNLDPSIFRGAVRCRLSGAFPVELVVKNSTGQTVWSQRVTGPREFMWDGRDFGNRPCPPGIYFFLIRDHGALTGAKIIRVR